MLIRAFTLSQANHQRRQNGPLFAQSLFPTPPLSRARSGSPPTENGDKIRRNLTRAFIPKNGKIYRLARGVGNFSSRKLNFCPTWQCRNSIYCLPTLFLHKVYLISLYILEFLFQFSTGRDYPIKCIRQICVFWHHCIEWPRLIACKLGAPKLSRKVNDPLDIASSWFSVGSFECLTFFLLLKCLTFSSEYATLSRFFQACPWCGKLSRIGTVSA